MSKPTPSTSPSPAWTDKGFRSRDEAIDAAADEGVEYYAEAKDLLFQGFYFEELREALRADLGGASPSYFAKASEGAFVRAARAYGAGDPGVSLLDALG